jgi:cytoskeleton protein RodZ
VLFPEWHAWASPDEAAPSTLRIEARADCWVGINDQKGALIFNRVVRANDHVTLTVVKPFTIRLGHTNGVSLSYEGRPIDLTPYQSRRTATIRIKDE